MRFDNPMWSADLDDANLVGACLTGEPDAFAQIVARYQSLVASIAYSATGSIAQSEDLAQETFLVAWRQLKSLEEPGKLRSWLCGIARRTTANAVRRQQREPSQGAEPLEQVMEVPAENAFPPDQAISREEEAILWRSLAQIPETYREPLILFYRQDQSVERVAEELELSTDAVRQRLSRGRKLLEGHVQSFVEGALRQSVPGRSFTAGVMSVLPAQLATGGLASFGASAAKGAAAKAGLFTVLASLAGYLPGLVSSYQAYKLDIAVADSDSARRAVRRFYAILAACTLTPVVLIYVAVSLRSMAITHPEVFAGVVIAIGFSWVPCAVILLAVMKQKASRAAALPNNTKIPLLEWRTNAAFLGLPLVHFRLGGDPGDRRPVKAWIAVGNVAFGGLMAFGPIAIAPICVGAFALGAVVFGGFSVGILTYSGFGFGVWGIGGCIMGLFTVGGCAVGWNAALGGIAIAREFALGGAAVALHANDATAQAYIQHSPFFQVSYLLVTKWLWPTMLAATMPSVLLSIALRRRARRASQT
jgi:RNA polymerase sigma factor (sigma-70 family)